MEIADIIFDEEIEQAIFSVVKNAQQCLVLVSPYNKYSDNLRRRLKESAEKKVLIVALCREDLRKDEVRAQSEQVRWLREDLRAEVHLVKGLHAKAYYNESTGIVTSMNLHAGSADNSREIGFVVEDKVALGKIHDYIRSLVDNSEQVASFRGSSNATKSGMSGSCIGCGNEIGYDTKRPRCLDCHQSWDKNQDSPESYCHRCGQERRAAFGRPISFKRPLCARCYKATTSAK